MIPLATAVWPSFAARDLWRWFMIVMGLLLITHGLFSKTVRMRDATWRGKIATKPWQIVFMRTLFVLIGASCINFAFTFAD